MGVVLFPRRDLTALLRGSALGLYVSGGETLAVKGCHVCLDAVGRVEGYGRILEAADGVVRRDVRGLVWRAQGCRPRGVERLGD